MSKSVAADESRVELWFRVGDTNHPEWAKYIVEKVALPFTKYKTGTALKLYVEKGTDFSRLGRQTFDDFLDNLDPQTYGLRLKKGATKAEAQKVLRRQSTFFGKTNEIGALLPPQEGQLKTGGQSDEVFVDTVEDLPDQELTKLDLLMKYYVVSDRQIEKWQERVDQDNTGTSEEQRALYAVIMPTVGKTAKDEAMRIDRARWEAVNQSQNPFELMKFVKEVCNKELANVKESRRAIFHSIKQDQNELVAGLLDRFVKAKEAYILVGGIVEEYDESRLFVDSINEVKLNGELGKKKVDYTNKEKLPPLHELVTLFADWEEGFIALEKKQNPSKALGSTSTGNASTRGQGGSRSGSHNGRSGGSFGGGNNAGKSGRRRCNTCAAVHKDDPKFAEVGYDHLWRDKACPNYEKRKVEGTSGESRGRSQSRGRGRDGGQSKSRERSKYKCIFCELIAGEAADHFAGQNCPNYEAGRKALAAAGSTKSGAGGASKGLYSYFRDHTTWDAISDEFDDADSDDETEDFFSKAYLGDAFELVKSIAKNIVESKQKPQGSSR